MNRIVSPFPRQTDLDPVATPAKADAGHSLAKVRAAILREFLTIYREQPRLVLLALSEAEALAWQSGFADLFFPALAAEKVRAVAAWHARQETLRRTQPIQWFAA